MDSFQMENGETIYYHIPQYIEEHRQDRFPMILFMCGTACDPVENAVDSGWVELAEKENLIIVSPDYNNYATYSETDFLISVVEYMLKNYPVDPERVYSTGFSNGGAASVALTSDYPQYFAAISAMGWMVDLHENANGKQYDMPFQVIQGNGEYTEKTDSGAMAVMEDEKRAIRSLLLYNEMLTSDVQADYDRNPYWGYKADDTETLILSDREWKISNYYKKGYTSPFAQFVLVDDKQHRPREEEAEVAWDFFKCFVRKKNGTLVDAGESKVSG